MIREGGAGRHETCDGNKMLLCPMTGCGQPMALESPQGYDARTGLEGVWCRRCGHRGVKARDGLQLLFVGQHEYVFSYGPSPSCLKVLLSSAVLNVFSGQGMTPARLATHIAEWALLKGQSVARCGHRAIWFFRVVMSTAGDRRRAVLRFHRCRPFHG